MIGLGSNRLSVCRRGGMRVTQAGKGGMEWLAGGRVPSWASPYSAQATVALKAQFPTQWPTIRDYGFAHPALVPFINEDPMMVMSLIEGLGTRCLYGSGSLRSQTSFSKGSDLDVSIDFISYNSTATWGSLFMQGSGAGSNASIFLLGFNGNTTTGYAWIGANNYTQGFAITRGQRYKMRIKNKEGFWIDGVKKWSTTNQSSNASSQLTAGSGFEIKIYSLTCKDTLNNIDWNFVPFNDNGTLCLLDVNGLQERMEISGGSFTISETPAS